MRQRSFTPVAIWAVLAFPSFACDARDKAAIAPPATTAASARRARLSERAADAVAPMAPAPEAAPGERDAAAGGDQLPTRTAATDSGGSMLIRTGNASVEVDTLEPAIRNLEALATRLGGYIANTSLQGGREQLRQAMLELKVPAAAFEQLTAGLTPLGTVEYVTVNAEDVGEEYTDVAARVANARRLETRLVDLLAARTGKLQDVLAVERELARVRETIERYEGRLRYLKTRVATSTLTVTLHEPPPLLTGNPGRNVLADAFVRAWRNFVAVVAMLIASLGVVVPLGAVAAALAFWWRRRGPSRRRASPPASV